MIGKSSRMIDERVDDRRPNDNAPMSSRAPDVRRARLPRLASWFVEVTTANAGGAVYGAVMVGVLLAAEDARHEDYPATIEAAAIVLLLYWLTNLYTHALGRVALTAGAAGHLGSDRSRGGHRAGTDQREARAALTTRVTDPGRVDLRPGSVEGLRRDGSRRCLRSRSRLV
jgi:hypothetical protein